MWFSFLLKHNYYGLSYGSAIFGTCAVHWIDNEDIKQKKAASGKPIWFIWFLKLNLMNDYTMSKWGWYENKNVDIM